MFLDPQDEVGPSISSSVVLCSFVLLVVVVLSVGPLHPFEDFTSILVSPGYVTGPSQCESSGGAATLMPLDLHAFL